MDTPRTTALFGENIMVGGSLVRWSPVEVNIPRVRWVRTGRCCCTFECNTYIGYWWSQPLLLVVGLIINSKSNLADMVCIECARDVRLNS
jgi:hypothetical protein